ncbi:hypothetical protein niasHT_010104 [Heterodera trifolii]|uniref:Uncharacterized protein n=1 Tax=Heterodera trifolii TaxID=157864 RepID=A0ABD2LWS1_9BILA
MDRRGVGREGKGGEGRGSWERNEWVSGGGGKWGRLLNRSTRGGYLKEEGMGEAAGISLHRRLIVNPIALVEVRPLPPTPNHLVRHYIVVQASAEDYVIAPAVFEHEPFFMQIRNNILNNMYLQPGLAVGDILVVVGYYWHAAFERVALNGHPTLPGWLHQGQIVSQAEADMVQSIAFVPRFVMHGVVENINFGRHVDHLQVCSVYRISARTAVTTAALACSPISVPPTILDGQTSTSSSNFVAKSAPRICRDRRVQQRAGPSQQTNSTRMH